MTVPLKKLIEEKILHYISPKNSKIHQNPETHFADWSCTNYCNSKLSKNNQLEKDIHLFFCKEIKVQRSYFGRVVPRFL